MMDLRKRLPILLLVLSVCFLTEARAQVVTISGTVYDISARRPLEAVGVLSSSGRGTITDSLGKYTITVPARDSIWFSLIGKTTMKYPVDTITNLDNFNVMIHIRSFELPEVKVRNSYYKFDSLQNRKDYAKIFDFKKPGLRLSNNPTYNPGGLTVGFDLDEIINMFRVKRNRSILSLQKRLLDQEQEKYVNNRFSKQFVRKITKLTSPELDTFMVRYRPDYEVVQLLNDLELGYYIQQSFEQYKASKNVPRGALRRREE
jgi:hypothetical protein